MSLFEETIYPAPLLCDFYKISHREQYPEGTEYVYSTWIPRASMIDGIDTVVAFGFQYFVKEYLIDYFQKHFFDRPYEDVELEYVRFIANTLGDPNPTVAHLRDLHALGFLPVRVKAVPEGTSVPLRVPMLTIENTDPRFFWVTNFLETILSAEVWHPCTSATIAREYRKTLDQWAKETGGDLQFVPFQGHDFSMRGMEGLYAAAKGGAGHLLSFTGTDTIPSISFMERYYNADITKELVGTSIPATEHSVMCAYGTDEESAYREILTKRYPQGFVSVVSDTYNFWDVLTEILPNLKDEIMARDGKLVIRPDSGDPVDIVAGFPEDRNSDDPREQKGAVELLWEVFGGSVNEQGFKVLDSHVGVIYGDSITLARAEAISQRLAAKGFASTNVVYGIGSYTYQYCTRDTFGFALKSTWVQIDGEERNIFKDPATDKKKVKKSLTGRVVVSRAEAVPGKPLRAYDSLSLAQSKSLEGLDELRTIFEDGKLVVDDNLSDIRARVLAS